MNSIESIITYDAAKSIINYCPNSGVFTWKTSRGGRKAGDIAGHVRESSSGKYHCVTIRILNKLVLGHRLGWLLYYGEWPQKNIDHKNCDATDNRISNLREATQSENMQNKRIACHNKSGYKGVSFDKINSKWVARIRVPKGSYRNLGRFELPEDAHKAYMSASNDLFKEFARHK